MCWRAKTRIPMMRESRAYGWMFLVLLGFLLACRLWIGGEHRDDPGAVQVQRQAPAEKSPENPAPVHGGRAWGPSPFTVAAQVDRAAVARMRHEKMKALGYETPDKYYQMSLAQLQALAQEGDPYAMLQLAEQYYSEVEFIKGDPGFERDAKPKDVAMKYFEGAFLSGYVRVSAVVSMQMAAENKLVDAYAWQLLAQRYNDHTNDKVYGQYGTFATMSAMDKAAAQAKFDAMWQRILARAEAMHPG